ncbi:MAG: PepSY-associated TM helix domain-containing protein [Desulfovibrio sp.]|jgi:hypothetical protein|nr:PepSY-associated TM helix domain-containing protein [Desulfovibrio sp.]
MTEQDEKELSRVAHLDIDWELTPEDAVLLHMEQDESHGHLFLPAVGRPEDSSRYFVVDTCYDPPVIRLQERSRVVLNALLTFPVPEALRPAVRARLGADRGTFAPPPEVLAWLRQAMDRLSRGRRAEEKAS